MTPPPRFTPDRRCRNQAISRALAMPSKNSLKLLPGQFPARLLLGQVYIALKDSKAAEDQLEAALLLQPAASKPGCPWQRADR